MLKISKIKKRKIKVLFPLSLYIHGAAALLTLPVFLCFHLFLIKQNFSIGAFFALSLVIQVWAYKFKKLKNSQFVDRKWLKTIHKITPSQLDQYMNFNFFGYGLMKLVFIGLLAVFPHKETAIAFLPFYMIAFNVLKLFLYRLGFLPIPRGLEDVKLEKMKPVKMLHVDLPYQYATGYTILTRK